jgi:hypothetical protein
MIQYIRGCIGEDRDTVLDMGRIPDYDTREWMPSGLSKGKGRTPDDASTNAAEPAPKCARMTKAQGQRSTSTMTNEDGFTPLTPENDRGHSDTSDDERRGSSSVMDSSEYPPVSDAEQEPRKFKTEDVRMAQSVQVLTHHQPTT